MGRLVIDNGQRWLRFSPTDAAFGKNPGQLPPISVPNVDDPAFGTLLASVIEQTKAKLNELSAEQQHVVAEQEWFRTNLPNVKDADGINALIDRAKLAGKSCITLLHARATDIGLTGDKATGTYVAKETEAA